MKKFNILYETIYGEQRQTTVEALNEKEAEKYILCNKVDCMKVVAVNPKK